MGEENGVESSLLCMAICSVLIIFFIRTLFTIPFLDDLFQASFEGNSLGMLVFLLCLAGVVHYLVRTNDYNTQEKELADLPFSSVLQIDDPFRPWYPTSDPTSYWPWSTESEPPPSSPTAVYPSSYSAASYTSSSSPAASYPSTAFYPSSSSAASYPPSSPTTSYLQSSQAAYYPSSSSSESPYAPSSPTTSYPPSSQAAYYPSSLSSESSYAPSSPTASYPPSSQAASYPSSSSSPGTSYSTSSSFSSFYSPPPPPFRVRPPTFIMRGDLARMVSDFSLSLSEDSRFEYSGDSDIDTAVGTSYNPD